MALSNLDTIYRHVLLVHCLVSMPVSLVVFWLCPISSGEWEDCIRRIIEQALTLMNNREFGLNDKSDSAKADLQGNLVTTMQAGAVLGALISSPIADRKGRKPSLLLVAITGLIGGLMQAFSYGHLSCFYIGR